MIKITLEKYSFVIVIPLPFFFFFSFPSYLPTCFQAKRLSIEHPDKQGVVQNVNKIQDDAVICNRPNGSHDNFEKKIPFYCSY